MARTPVTGSPGPFSSYGLLVLVDRERPAEQEAVGGLGACVGTPLAGISILATSLPWAVTIFTSKRSSGRGGGPAVTRPSES